MKTDFVECGHADIMSYMPHGGYNGLSERQMLWAAGKAALGLE